MAIVKHAINENDVVAFIDAVDKVESAGRWPAGTRGAVISDYGDFKMVEIANEQGETLDMPVVSEEKLKLIAKHSE